MYDLNETLLKSVEAEASDIHLTVGRAPSYRIDGCLLPLKGERLMDVFPPVKQQEWSFSL